MKKLIIISLLLCSLFTNIQAQKLSPEEQELLKENLHFITKLSEARTDLSEKFFILEKEFKANPKLFKKNNGIARLWEISRNHPGEDWALGASYTMNKVMDSLPVDTYFKQFYYYLNVRDSWHDNRRAIYTMVIILTAMG